MKNNRKIPLIFWAVLFVIGVAFISAPLVTAKGGNFSKVIVSGGTLSGEVEISDESLLGFFSFSYFPDSETEEPDIFEGYTVTRGGRSEDGTFQAWDRLHYFPNKNGAGGFVFYEGLVNGWSEYDGKWYTASPEGDAAFRNFLAAQNAGNRTEIHVYKKFTVPSLGLEILTIG